MERSTRPAFFIFIVPNFWGHRKKQTVVLRSLSGRQNACILKQGGMLDMPEFYA
jgi:hypothetical protein